MFCFSVKIHKIDVYEVGAHVFIAEHLVGIIVKKGYEKNNIWLHQIDRHILRAE